MMADCCRANVMNHSAPDDDRPAAPAALQNSGDVRERPHVPADTPLPATAVALSTTVSLTPTDVEMPNSSQGVKAAVQPALVPAEARPTIPTASTATVGHVDVDVDMTNSNQEARADVQPEVALPEPQILTAMATADAAAGDELAAGAGAAGAGAAGPSAAQQSSPQVEGPSIANGTSPAQPQEPAEAEEAPAIYQQQLADLRQLARDSKRARLDKGLPPIPPEGHVRDHPLHFQLLLNRIPEAAQASLEELFSLTDSLTPSLLQQTANMVGCSQEVIAAYMNRLRHTARTHVRMHLEDLHSDGPAGDASQGADWVVDEEQKLQLQRMALSKFRQGNEAAKLENSQQFVKLMGTAKCMELRDEMVRVLEQTTSPGLIAALKAAGAARHTARWLAEAEADDQISLTAACIRGLVNLGQDVIVSNPTVLKTVQRLSRHHNPAVASAAAGAVEAHLVMDMSKVARGRGRPPATQAKRGRPRKVVILPVKSEGRAQQPLALTTATPIAVPSAAGDQKELSEEGAANGHRITHLPTADLTEGPTLQWATPPALRGYQAAGTASVPVQAADIDACQQSQRESQNPSMRYVSGPLQVPPDPLEWEKPTTAPHAVHRPAAVPFSPVDREELALQRQAMAAAGVTDLSLLQCHPPPS